MVNDTPEIGDEEGALCNREGCPGLMIINVVGCTCWSGHGPCGACMTSLQCDECSIRTNPDGEDFYDD